MSNKMALDALTAAIEAMESCEEGDYSTGHVCHPSFDSDAIDAAIEQARAAIAALQAEPQPAPYLCIAPACGAKCSDCNSAISDATMRRYAIRYAYLREHDPRFGMPAAWLAFQTLDEAIEAALPTPPKD